jgi:hypothetical protein
MAMEEEEERRLSNDPIPPRWWLRANSFILDGALGR